MKRTNNAFFFSAIFAIVLQTGSCIRCYNCISKDNSKCLNPETELQPEECTPKLLADFGANTKNIASNLGSIFGLDIPQNTPNIDVPPMNCLKMESMVGNEKVTFRGCQLARTPTLDFCKNAMENLNHNHKVIHCSLCDTDACNSSPLGVTPVSMMVLLVPAIVTMKNGWGYITG